MCLNQAELIVIGVFLSGVTIVSAMLSSWLICSRSDSSDR